MTSAQETCCKCGVGKSSANAVLLGRSIADPPSRSMGFGGTPASAVFGGGDGELLADSGEGHVLVIAPTGAGKGRNVIIPNLLNYAGPAIVIDPKGEAARITGRQRRAMGQKVITIDPFGACGKTTDSLNPFDLLNPQDPSFEADCLMLAKMVTGGQMSHVDRFWDQCAESLLAGTIAYFAEYMPASKRNMSQLREFFCGTDISYNIAVILDTTLNGKSSLAVDEFKNFLSHEGEKVRTSVRSSVAQHMTTFAGEQVGRAIRSSSFRVSHVTSGSPLTIYLVIPPHKLEAYGPLLRLWASVLLTLVTRREQAPALPTLFIFDELAQLGAFPLLRPAVTLLRGYGVRCMLFLQDVNQLRALFPADYATIVNNCASVVTFGHTSFAMSREMAQLLGDMTEESLFDMERGALAVRRNGKHTELIGRLDYLSDEIFRGKYDPNPMAQPRSLASAINLS